MGKPPLWDIVNFLYHGVMDNMPKAIQDRDMSAAFVLGVAGSYAVVKVLQLTSRRRMDKLIPTFDEKWLPILEKTCIAAATVAPLLYAVIDPEGAREIMTWHPTYTTGMAGAYLGSVIAAMQDLHRRSHSIRNWTIENNSESR